MTNLSTADQIRIGILALNAILVLVLVYLLIVMAWDNYTIRQEHLDKKCGEYQRRGIPLKGECEGWTR